MKKDTTIVEINSYLLLLLSFFITVSVYITDVIILLLFISWFFNGNLKKKIKSILKDPLLYPSICFFIYSVISYSWSDSSIINNTMQKQILLLLLPVLYTLDYKDTYIEKAKKTFILGLILNTILSVFTLFSPTNIFFKKGHYDSNLFLHGFLDHFDYAIFLCFGIFLLLSFIEKRNFLTYFTLIIIFLIALLNSYGRVGIISLLVFLPIIILLQQSKNKYYSLVGLFFIIIFSYYIFAPFQNRIHQTISSVKLIYNDLTFQEKVENDAAYMAMMHDTLSKEYFINEILKNKDWSASIEKKSNRYQTSIGQRYLYIKNSLVLLKQQPVLGIGSNQFEVFYTTIYPNVKPLKHPHNNYIFILIELGIVGLGIMLYIFYKKILIFFSTNKKDFLKLIFPLFFLWIMLFDNYFLNHNTLVFFCLFSFILYSKESIYNQS